MAGFHSRSNSFPSQTHPLVQCVEDELCRLKSSEDTSISASSVSSKLAALVDLHEGINNLIQMPSFQQALSQERGQYWINELIEGSLRLVDLCDSSRDVVYLTKESVQDLESSIRRSRGETDTKGHINAYLATRKKINKMVNKNLKSFNPPCTEIPDRDSDLKSIGTLLKETESLDSRVCVPTLVWRKGEIKLIAFKVHSNQACVFGTRKGMDNMTVMNLLKKSEMNIKELEKGLESLFRSLVKTRVSLLNILSQ